MPFLIMVQLGVARLSIHTYKVDMHNKRILPVRLFKNLFAV